MIRASIGLVSAILLLLARPAVGADGISNGQWFHPFLRVTDANVLSTGTNTVVAIVDSGVDAQHPDLSGSLLPGVDLTGPGDGRVDVNGHGTAMAGLVAAHGRVKGIAPGVLVLPIRTSESGSGGADILAAGIRSAVGRGATVISVSRVIPSDDLLLHQEVQAALLRDVVVVAAVGNRPESQAVQWPAAIPGVLAVAGVDQNGNHSAVSVTGPEVVIAAPSDNISSTGLNGTWQVATGTSDATAIVAGAVALIRSRFPQLKATEVIRRITSTAIDKGPPGRDNEYGHGILNIVGALTAELPTTATPTKKTSEKPTQPVEHDRFPWWLIALPVGVGVAALGFQAWRRQRTTR